LAVYKVCVSFRGDEEAQGDWNVMLSVHENICETD
jgi:hypothetical protein